MAELLCGVDLGTTGTRAVLYRVDGTPVAEASRDTPLRWQGPGRVDQDPDDFVAAALEAIADCVRRAEVPPGDVAAIGVSGQMAGILGMGADGTASTPYDSWLDIRCAGELAELDRAHGDALVRVGGCPPMVNHAPKLRWWRRHRREAFDATVRWVMPAGYVASRLAGLRPDEAFIDVTYLHFTGLADARAGAWSEELCAALEVPMARLPRIVEPATVVGALTAEAADASGLSRGTPIAAGLGDTAASALGAGIVRPGQLLDVAGTAAVLAVSTDRFVPDERSRTLIAMRGAVAGQWIWLSFLSGGSLLPWLSEVLAGGAGGAGADGEGFASLTAEAAGAPVGSAGLVFVPHLDGRLLPSDAALRGAWLGLHRDHRRPHLVRAVLESVAYEYAGYLRAVTALDPSYAATAGHVVGGGARSAVWNAIKASVLGVPLHGLVREELTCWGAALVAGAAVGLVDDLAAAATAGTVVARRYEPVPLEHATYREYESVYRDAVSAAASVSGRLSALAAEGEVRE
ncbi:MAG: xylulose kinase [Streptosporangiales bacterium]|nr:xylulose kinase [Streptosporangiales bacterium]